MSIGIVQVVVFDKVFDGEVGEYLGDKRFEVFVPELNQTIITERDTDYAVGAVAVPFSPLTRAGLHAAELAASNALDAMEFGLTLHNRRKATQ